MPWAEEPGAAWPRPGAAGRAPVRARAGSCTGPAGMAKSAGLSWRGWWRDLWLVGRGSIRWRVLAILPACDVAGVSVMVG
ncbi:MAG: hypothetical protein WBN94_08695 [Methanothrix sp.]